MTSQVYYHGTNQDFAEFMRVPPNRATHGASNSSGIFLTSSRVVAAQYAKLAQKKFYPDNHDQVEQNIRDLVDQAGLAARRGRMSEYERLTEAAGDLEAEMRQTEHGARILHVAANVENVKVLENVDCLDLYEMTEILAVAKRDGYDAVLFEGIIDSVSEVPDGEIYSHLVVFDPAACAIVDVEFLPAADGSPMPENMAPINRSLVKTVDPFAIDPEAAFERQLELA